jgi:hypothetical protein
VQAVVVMLCYANQLIEIHINCIMVYSVPYFIEAKVLYYQLIIAVCISGFIVRASLHVSENDSHAIYIIFRIAE